MTRANLEAALAGEALSALRYRCFADAAAEEGFGDIARLFERIAAEELSEHAAELVAALEIRGHTRENLIRAIERETAKHRRCYTEYATQAERVGDGAAAALFEKLAGDERVHAEWLRESLGRMPGSEVPAGCSGQVEGPGAADRRSH